MVWCITPSIAGVTPYMYMIAHAPQLVAHPTMLSQHIAHPTMLSQHIAHHCIPCMCTPRTALHVHTQRHVPLTACCLHAACVHPPQAVIADGEAAQQEQQSHTTHGIPGRRWQQLAARAPTYLHGSCYAYLHCPLRAVIIRITHGITYSTQ